MSEPYTVIVEQRADEPALPSGSPSVPPTAAIAVPPPPPPAAGVALQRREVWVEVPGYEGYQILLWLNYPRHWEEAIQGANFRPFPPRPDVEGGDTDALNPWTEQVKAWSAEREASMRAALGRVVLRHNGWCDYPPPDGTGEVLPQPQDPRFWDMIPQELADTVLALRVQKAADLPNSLAPAKRRR